MGSDLSFRSTTGKRVHRLALLLCVAIAAFSGLLVGGAQAATFEFPSSSSTVVSDSGAPSNSVGYFWSKARGDMVEQSFSGPSSIDHATLSVQPVSNTLSPGFKVEWTMSVNGTDVGSFSVPSATTSPIVFSPSFPPIAGPVYLVKLRVINEIPSGKGAHTLASTGSPGQHSLELSNVEAPDTRLSSGPPALTTGTSATFAFDSSQLDLGGFRCSIDHTSFVPCTSPRTYDALAVGAHSFEVSAVDVFDNVDATPATWQWTIVSPSVAKKPAKFRRCKKGFKKVKKHGKAVCVKRKHHKRKHRR